MKEEEQVRLLEEAAAGKLDPGKLHSMFLSYEPRIPEMPATEAVLATIPASPHHPGATYRLAGDRYRPRLPLARFISPHPSRQTYCISDDIPLQSTVRCHASLVGNPCLRSSTSTLGRRKIFRPRFLIIETWPQRLWMRGLSSTWQVIARVQGIAPPCRKRLLFLP